MFIAFYNKLHNIVGHNSSHTIITIIVENLTRHLRDKKLSSGTIDSVATMLQLKSAVTVRYIATFLKAYFLFEDQNDTHNILPSAVRAETP
jgi:hypothetical protein